MRTLTTCVDTEQIDRAIGNLMVDGVLLDHVNLVHAKREDLNERYK
jgi:hypothetical protein